MNSTSSIPKEDYNKEVGKCTFILSWIPVSIVGALIFACTWIVLDIIDGVLTESNFSIRDYLAGESVIIDPYLKPLVFFVLFLFWGWRRYRSMKKKPFSSITDENIILNFGKNLFSWNDIQTVTLEGERKLAISFEKKGKIKKKIFDIDWISKKEDFILSMKNKCTKRNIPFCESDMTFSSQVRLLLNPILE